MFQSVVGTSSPNTKPITVNADSMKLNSGGEIILFNGNGNVVVEAKDIVCIAPPHSFVVCVDNMDNGEVQSTETV